MAEMVTLTIDGREVSVPKGTTILEAAKTIGTEVPHYCYHPGMSSPAMCRLCLVEVEGAPKPLKEGIPKEDAEKLKEEIEAAGGTAEVK